MLHAKKTLRDVNANIVGVVLNKVRVDPSAYAYDYYGYSHHAGSLGSAGTEPRIPTGAGPSKPRTSRR